MGTMVCFITRAQRGVAATNKSHRWTQIEIQKTEVTTGFHHPDIAPEMNSGQGIGAGGDAENTERERGGTWLMVQG